MAECCCRKIVIVKTSGDDKSAKTYMKAETTETKGEQIMDKNMLKKELENGKSLKEALDGTKGKIYPNSYGSPIFVDLSARGDDICRIGEFDTCNIDDEKKDLSAEEVENILHSADIWNDILKSCYNCEDYALDMLDSTEGFDFSAELDSYEDSVDPEEFKENYGFSLPDSDDTTDDERTDTSGDAPKESGRIKIARTDRFVLTVHDYSAEEDVDEISVIELTGCTDYASAVEMAGECFRHDLAIERAENANEVNEDRTDWDKESGRGTIEWNDGMTADYKVIPLDKADM